LLNLNIILTHYCAGDKIEKNRVGEARSSDGEKRGMYRVLVGKPEGKRPGVDERIILRQIYEK
jgi:hypothetical protein